ncbi:MAG: hypothetical protein J2P54_09725 [Bradyrhizobiaceae bacterium]|nr:hypothetical protein [Bradyrhizobiaceae bacterium]
MNLTKAEPGQSTGRDILAGAGPFPFVNLFSKSALSKWIAGGTFYPRSLAYLARPLPWPVHSTRLITHGIGASA